MLYFPLNLNFSKWDQQVKKTIIYFIISSVMNFFVPAIFCQ